MTKGSIPKMLAVVLFLVFWCPAVQAIDQEPLCLSRYDYDYKILRNIVTLEQKVEEMQKAMESQKDANSKQEQDIENMRTSQEDITRGLERRIEDITFGSGSTYVRWGRTSCPGNGTETVYTGYAAGSQHSHTGAAVNYMCLPTKPLWGDYDGSSQNNGAFMWGAEYQIFGSYSNKMFKKDLGNHDVPCAVCRSVRTSVLMVPGRNACYDGWSVEYTGYLSAGHHTHPAASEYVCLDGDPEVITGSKSDKNGKLFYPTEAKCGSLPCPPYVEGRELTCVLCTL